MPIGRRAAAFIVAVLLVSASVGLAVDQGHEEIAPVEEGQALVPAIVGGAIVGGIVVGAALEYLGDDGVPQDQVDRMIEGETTQQEIDLTTGLLAQNESSRHYLTARRNHKTDARAIASMKAKAALAREINNGTTDVDELSTVVNETIDDYYAHQQVQLSERRDVQVYQIGYTADVLRDDANMSVLERFEITLKVDSDQGRLAIENGNIRNETATATLANGSEIETEKIHIEGRVDDPGGFHDGTWNSTVNNATAGPWRPDGWIQTLEISGNKSTKNYTQRHGVYNHHKWANLYESYNTSAEQLKNNSNYGPVFVEAVVAQYQAGELNTSELIAPEILANEWGTAYNQTGDSTYGWATFAALGTEMPNLNRTASMQVEYVEPRPVRHVTFVPSDPDDSLADDPPYNVSVDYNGSQVSKRIVDEDGDLQNATFALPVADGPQVTDATIYLTSPTGGAILNWTESGVSTSFEGVDVETEESYNRTVSEWGMLFASDGPDEWQVNHQYDPDNHGSVYFAAEDGDLNLVRENFTVVAITNDGGQNLTSVETRSYNKQTATASNFTEELRQLTDLREEVETRAEPVGGGGGLLPDLGGSGGPILGGLIILGGFIVIAKLAD